MEEYVILKNFPDYKINIHGDILNKHNKKIKKILGNTGYYNVNLRIKKGVNKKEYIHRLLAQTFILNEDNKPFVDHINRIKTDNRIENLRWVTPFENANNINIKYKSAITKIVEKNNKWFLYFDKQRFCYDNLDAAYLKLKELIS